MTNLDSDWAATLYDQQHKIWSAWSAADGDSESVAVFLEAATGLQGGTALDLGCGVGREACALAARGWSAHGVDLSGSLIRKARERASGLGVERATFQQYDLQADRLQKSFDLVYSWDSVFAIWDQKGQEELVRSWSGALKPGGLFVLGQLNRAVFSLKNDERIEMSGSWIGPGRTERRLHWDEAAGEYQDSVTWFPEEGLPQQLPTQRLQLLTDAELVGTLRAAGLVDVRLVGTDGWKLEWPGVLPPTSESNQVVAVGRRVK